MVIQPVGQIIVRSECARTSPRRRGSNQITFAQLDVQFAEADADNLIEERDRVNNRDDNVAAFYRARSLNRTAGFGDVAFGDRYAIHREHRDRSGVGAKTGLNVLQDH